MQLGKQAIHVARAFDGWRQFEWFLSLGQLISGCVAATAVPFVRKDFGERYFSPINLFFGYCFIAPLTLFGGALGVVSGVGFSKLMVVVFLSFLALSFYHRMEIRRRNRAGEVWHTLYIGTSILPLPFSAEVVHKWIEPLFFFVGAVVMLKPAPIVSLWMSMSSFALLVNSHLGYYFERQAILDLRDAQIESRNRAKALAGRPPHETQGFAMAESTLQLIRKDGGLKEAFAALPDDLKGVLNAA